MHDAKFSAGATPAGARRRDEAKGPQPVRDGEASPSSQASKGEASGADRMSDGLPSQDSGELASLFSSEPPHGSDAETEDESEDALAEPRVIILDNGAPLLVVPSEEKQLLLPAGQTWRVNIIDAETAVLECSSNPKKYPRRFLHQALRSSRTEEMDEKYKPRARKDRGGWNLFVHRTVHAT